MSERVCGNCRWWRCDANWTNQRSGLCVRRKPTGEGKWPAANITDFCGEWADKTITPEQEERQKLVRHFAVALMIRHGDNLLVHNAWELAREMADAETKSGGQ
jgi:hypothetical protein